MSALAELLGLKVKAEVFRLLFGAGEGPLHLRAMPRRFIVGDEGSLAEL